MCMAMSAAFERLRQTWNELGRDDPLWAVLSHPDKRGGRWDISEFIQTGERDVSRLHRAMMERAAAPSWFRHILDFGCGVGRLSHAWRRRAARVTGVDISEGMIEAGRRVFSACSGLELVVNSTHNLKAWDGETFDLVFSYICLQHMPWGIAAGYLAEFARVCCQGGLVAVQIPSHRLDSGGYSLLRRRLVNALPFGLDRRYRKWRHGAATAFDMFFTPPPVVIACARSNGLELLHQEADCAAGSETVGFFYVFRKTPTLPTAAEPEVHTERICSKSSSLL